jgi:hypothetical protein
MWNLILLHVDIPLNERRHWSRFRAFLKTRKWASLYPKPCFITIMVGSWMSPRLMCWKAGPSWECS